jgi:hypothetical protein
MATIRGVGSAPKSSVFLSNSINHPQIAQIFTDSKQVTLASILLSASFRRYSSGAGGRQVEPKIICGNLCNLWI